MVTELPGKLSIRRCNGYVVESRRAVCTKNRFSVRKRQQRMANGIKGRMRSSGKRGHKTKMHSSCISSDHISVMWRDALYTLCCQWIAAECNKNVVIKSRPLSLFSAGKPQESRDASKTIVLSALFFSSCSQGSWHNGKFICFIFISTIKSQLNDGAKSRRSSVPILWTIIKKSTAECR